MSEVLTALEAAGVPAGRIYAVADIAHDPHYQARGMLVPSALADGSEILLPGIVPRLSRTPGSHRQAAPTLGQHTQQVLDELAARATANLPPSRTEQPK